MSTHMKDPTISQGYFFLHLWNIKPLHKHIHNFTLISVACAIDTNVNLLQYKVDSTYNIVLQGIYPIFEESNTKGNPT
jgi:hypothetical protein